MDASLGKRLEVIYKKRGIDIRTKAQVTGLQTEANQLRVMLDTGESLKAGLVCAAIGRERDFSRLRLRDIGVSFKGAFLQTNEFLETSVPGLFAIGDLVDAPQFAHAAAYAGEAIIRNFQATKPESITFEHVPAVVFSDPPVASVGLFSKTDGSASECQEIKIPLGLSARAWVEKDLDGFVTLLATQSEGRIVGAHILGAEAPELIGFLSLMIRKKMTLADLRQAVFPHPSYAELLAEAARRAQPT
jgi:dihydrolipoamide dehydrogenase